MDYTAKSVENTDIQVVTYWWIVFFVCLFYNILFCTINICAQIVLIHNQ